ncbi:MAG: zinc-binding dehydrogenase [Rhizobiales bacterium]|nr:zinc-binding dehydrogenase [Hyphomicrobiales bacterium]
MRQDGADLAIDGSADDWVALAKEITEGRRVDVVLDVVGGDYFGRNLASLAEDGRYAPISLQSGKIVTADLDPLLRRRLTFTGSTLRPLSPRQKADIMRHVHECVRPLIASGSIRPHIHQVFALEDVADAHRLLDRGRSSASSFWMLTLHVASLFSAALRLSKSLDCTTSASPPCKTTRISSGAQFLTAKETLSTPCSRVRNRTRRS